MGEISDALKKANAEREALVLYGKGGIHGWLSRLDRKGTEHG